MMRFVPTKLIPRFEFVMPLSSSQFSCAMVVTKVNVYCILLLQYCTQYSVFLLSKFKLNLEGGSCLNVRSSFAYCVSQENIVSKVSAFEQTLLGKLILFESALSFLLLFHKISSQFRPPKRNRTPETTIKNSKTHLSVPHLWAFPSSSSFSLSFGQLSTQ